MHDYGRADRTAAEALAADVNDRGRPWVGSHLKNRFAEDLGLEHYDSEPVIMELLAQYGITMNEDGLALVP